MVMYHSDLSGERLDAEAWESRVNRIESNRIESRCVAVVSGTLRCSTKTTRRVGVACDRF